MRMRQTSRRLRKADEDVTTWKWWLWGGTRLGAGAGGGRGRPRCASASASSRSGQRGRLSGPLPSSNLLELQARCRLQRRGLGRHLARQYPESSRLRRGWLQERAARDRDDRWTAHHHHLRHAHRRRRPRLELLSQHHLHAADPRGLGVQRRRPFHVRGHPRHCQCQSVCAGSSNRRGASHHVRHQRGVRAGLSPNVGPD
mmetsp:Transcript_8178/g.25213  ORF Transcript_8178/g.25213 Transcript_8178/m.25213 type:complete len:200 (-) Transcript_8178:343-942(-)